MNKLSINLRIYGLFIQQHKVLLSDEFRLNKRMTKFPGGGLIPGEGTIECLQRECLEEMNQEIKVIRHFYTTDFFQRSQLIYPTQQIISIYYLAEFKGEIQFKVAENPFDYASEKEGSQSFRWENINELSMEMLSMPIDRIVLKLLKEASV